MSNTLSVKGNKPEVISSPLDFERLIDNCMGKDCAEYYRHQIEELTDYINEISEYIDDTAITEDTKEVLKINGF